MKAIGLYQNKYGHTFGMFVYACCLYHAQLYWRDYMKHTHPEMHVMYVRPVRLPEHKLNLPEVCYACRPCKDIERRYKV